MEKTTRVEDLSGDDLVAVLQRWSMVEFIDFVKEKQIDGRQLLEVSEGIVKLWRPKVNAKKFITFIQDMKTDPKKYIINVKHSKKSLETEKISDVSIESQYQTVTVRKVREEHFATTTVGGVEEILKKIVPAKSFLYRYHAKKSEKTGTSYLPMDGATVKKPKKFFRMSSYEYPNFDLRLRFSKADNFNDRGYYSIKTNSRYYIQKTYRNPESKPNYKSMSSVEELNDKITEDHFYEDLCYNDIENVNDDSIRKSIQPMVAVKPCMVKIQELFQSIKFPFFKKNDVAVEENKMIEDRLEQKCINDKRDKEKEAPVYENSDSVANMYDSIHVNSQERKEDKVKSAKVPIEDYLEPIQMNRDYCDVNYQQKEESILGYILSIFETRFGIRRETNDADQSGDSEVDDKDDAAADKKWNDKRKTNMAERPLPIPVENESYFMNIDRCEAENLLRGHPDGTFLLRPSSQPNHAYTISVCCANAVHNVGIRRRQDGRLALGFARRVERSFVSITALLRHHKRRRLLLVADGGLIGATTLNEPPHYYQTPKNIPVCCSS